MAEVAPRGRSPAAGTPATRPSSSSRPGVRQLHVAGEPFYDPEADGAFVAELKAAAAHIRVVERAHPHQRPGLRHRGRGTLIALMISNCGPPVGVLEVARRYTREEFLDRLRAEIGVAGRS